MVRAPSKWIVAQLLMNCTTRPFRGGSNVLEWRTVSLVCFLGFGPLCCLCIIYHPVILTNCCFAVLTNKGRPTEVIDPILLFAVRTDDDATILRGARIAVDVLYNCMHLWACVSDEVLELLKRINFFSWMDSLLGDKKFPFSAAGAGS